VVAGVQALDRKLLRDFRRLWAQALAIALVLACGVAVLIMSLGMSRALEDTRSTYYERNRFADVFAEARAMPNGLLAEIRAIPGVADAEGRIDATVILDLPGRSEAAVGRVLSLPEAGLPRLNVPILRFGRWPDPEAAGEVVVNAPFAEANGFRVGSRFEANLDGRLRELTVTGAALSPEFIYTIGPGALMPDNEGYGIIWMPRRAAEAAFGRTGAFDAAAIALISGADEEEVIAQVDRVLEPFAGTGAYARAEQTSNAFIDAEITQLRTLAYILPPVFLGVTIFLVNMVIGRIVALERSEIGLLKALGYRSTDICVHYLLLAGLIALTGVAVGMGVGAWLAIAMARQYAHFFDFPYLVFNVAWNTHLAAALIGFGAALAGAARAALAAARLAPAVAMAPPAPPRYRKTLLDGLLAALRLSQPTMMILRSLMRAPMRAGLTTLGMGLAVSVLVAANFVSDSLDAIIDHAFFQTYRQDAMLLFGQDVPASALEEVRALPGVLQVEGQRFRPATLASGPVSERVAIEARPPGADLARIVDGSGRALDAPPGGMLLSQSLADSLRLAPGDTVTVTFASGRRESVELPVTGTVELYFGLGAWMDAAYLDALLREGPRISVANITLDESRTEAFHAAIKEIPNLAGTVMLTENRRSFQETISANVLVVAAIYAGLGIMVTVGVAYNGARVQLSERARELASLRILGFSRGEVSYILVGETLLLALLAQPLGWAIGYLVADLMVRSFSSDLYRLPLVLEASTYAYASFVVLGAALASALLVRRRLDRLDLVAVMKTRE